MPALPRSFIDRRRFLTLLAAAVPTVALVRRAHAAALEHLKSDSRDLDALADAVLPSELGRAGIARVAADFRAWGAGYRENAELVHGYGTSRLRFTGPTPLTRWTTQLDALDAAARSAHDRAFRDLSRDDRESLVRAALAKERLDRMPAVGAANHVALALLAHFYDSADAADLCYTAKIGKSTCRPLAVSPHAPERKLRVLER
jgi:hypothetical protein